eukprot:TRINITY_DN3661_c0_g1_i3.p2 TRINITY_DN3661_c0_g1~~TRINITY_DN3661_c0_g1_i3.p2  ORF type:complete len:148 (-),score=10.59 TRINITY_DN3661_c0_g1_i3:275-658(-)
MCIRDRQQHFPNSTENDEIDSKPGIGVGNNQDVKEENIKFSYVPVYRRLKVVARKFHLKCVLTESCLRCCDFVVLNRFQRRASNSSISLRFLNDRLSVIKSYPIFLVVCCVRHVHNLPLKQMMQSNE